MDNAYLGLEEIKAELGDPSEMERIQERKTCTREAWLRFMYCVTQNIKLIDEISERTGYPDEFLASKKILPVISVKNTLEDTNDIIKGHSDGNLYQRYLGRSLRKLTIA